ncbi:TIGR02253 family HAD-type hydrolase [Candidatus Micrarchaeota archaeon]|nr:TIGR02253 family HAD-type hydrolase [Candidatus Micrarchaeota archaeon]
MVRYLLFDIDDTLFPSSEFAHLARSNAINAMIAMGLDEKKETLMHELYDIIQKKGSNYQYHFNDLCNRFGKRKEKAKLIAAAVSAYHNTKSSIQPFPEVPITLLQLRDKGYKLYIATNGDAVKQWDKLIRLGIALYFEDVFVSQELKVEKSPLFFEKVLQKIKAKPEECVMVGDRPDADINPAKKSDIITVRVRKGKHSKLKSNADYEITRFSKLLNTIRKIEKK